MTLPTMVSRVAFATAPYAVTPTWSDISSEFISASIRRGRMHELDRIEAGIAIIVLKNESGNYWPDNAGGAYYPNIKPRKRINLRATYGGTTYDLFTGFTERWKPGWRGKVGKAAIVTLSCADLIKPLSGSLLNDGAGYAQEKSDVRVGNVLDDINWPAADRDLNAGQSNMIASGALANIKAMSHLFLVQWSEAGYLFIAGDGDVQFHDRHARLKSPYTTSQAIFGDDAGENKYYTIEFSFDDEFIKNDIRIEREGGTEQVAADATSKTDYGLCSLSRTGLLMTTDSEALSQAQYFLKRYKDAVLRAKSITIYADRDPANLYPKVLNYDIGTRITVRLNQASVDKDYHIEGIQHDIDAIGRTWRCKWQLSDADAQQYWALGVAGFGELGQKTYLAY